MKIIAHRGFPAQYHDNTQPSFKAVCDHPLYPSIITGIELDVHLTADGRIPVHHDTIITDISGNRHDIAHLSFEDADRILREVIGKDYPGLTDLPAVLDLISHTGELNIEIKTGSYDLHRFTALFRQQLSEYRPAGDVILSSFSYDILEYLRRHLDGFDLRYAYIFQSEDALRSVPAGVRNRFDLLHCHYRLPLEKPVLFDSSTPIRCWTVNDIAILKALSECAERLPVEAIMTDDPDWAGRLQQSRKGHG